MEDFILAVVEVKDLTKRYGKHIAVEGLSFTVEKGQIYGFLGPNGLSGYDGFRISEIRGGVKTYPEKGAKTEYFGSHGTDKGDRSVGKADQKSFQRLQTEGRAGAGYFGRAGCGHSG